MQVYAATDNGPIQSYQGMMCTVWTARNTTVASFIGRNNIIERLRMSAEREKNGKREKSKKWVNSDGKLAHDRPCHVITVLCKSKTIYVQIKLISINDWDFFCHSKTNDVNIKPTVRESWWTISKFAVVGLKDREVKDQVVITRNSKNMSAQCRHTMRPSA